MRRIALVVLAIASIPATAALAAPVDGRNDLPACDWRQPLTYDCHITGPDMAINLMQWPPSRDKQPNAHAEYMQYELERARHTDPPTR